MLFRSERGIIDNRTIPNGGGTVTKNGNDEWNITAAMNNEIVGGICTLYYQIADKPEGAYVFKIRGKNPKDAAVRAYMDEALPDFAGYAWAIAQHETRGGTSGNRVLNQFNPDGTKAHLPNKTKNGNGWGIGQIDRSKQKPPGVVTTAEVWNWKVNVLAMNTALVNKRAMHREFMGDFARTYGKRANWTPLQGTQSHTFSNVTLSAESWATIVLYNGGGGVRQSKGIIKTDGKRYDINSPWAFGEGTGIWTFSDNGTNYAYKISRELRGLNPVEE